MASPAAPASKRLAGRMLLLPAAVDRLSRGLAPAAVLGRWRERDIELLQGEGIVGVGLAESQAHEAQDAGVARWPE
ncbi:MAG: hypothetical protein MUF09_10990, partial [Candidatus Nanopelagicales bacterium]|nr:hypothetical protein [Candidatus Nanopelagicales bacterium]